MLLSRLLTGLPVEIRRDADVTGFGPLTMTAEGLLHYFIDPRFEGQLQALSGTRSILTTPALAQTIPAAFGLALCDNPKEVFLKAYRLHGEAIEAPAPFANEIAPSANIHPRAVIGSHSVRIGANVTIGANAIVQERVVIEDDAVIGANSVLGGDGFEVGVVDGRQIVVPHFGSVLIRRGAVIKS
ncbi:MAG: hypothetical protein JWR77_1711, partial [Rhizorhabdus sp.]|nr:hypothetical protein [Rhizorhabdus sp.]